VTNRKKGEELAESRPFGINYQGGKEGPEKKFN